MRAEYIILIVLIILNLLGYGIYIFSYKKRNNYCKFKFSNIKYTKCKKTGTQYATFSIKILNNHRYFADFPISFKFYSDQRFKTSVKISYKTIKTEIPELIIDKVVLFKNKTKEYIHYINDVILGQIYIQIQANIEYGSPIIQFEILDNNNCILGDEYKLEIIFPE